jgi:hypothetical protein
MLWSVASAATTAPRTGQRDRLLYYGVRRVSNDADPLGHHPQTPPASAVVNGYVHTRDGRIAGSKGGAVGGVLKLEHVRASERGGARGARAHMAPLQRAHARHARAPVSGNKGEEGSGTERNGAGVEWGLGGRATVVSA